MALEKNGKKIVWAEVTSVRDRKGEKDKKEELLILGIIMCHLF